MPKKDGSWCFYHQDHDRDYICNCPVESVVPTMKTYQSLQITGPHTAKDLIEAGLGDLPTKAAFQDGLWVTTVLIACMWKTGEFPKTIKDIPPEQKFDAERGWVETGKSQTLRIEITHAPRYKWVLDTDCGRITIGFSDEPATNITSHDMLVVDRLEESECFQK